METGNGNNTATKKILYVGFRLFAICAVASVTLGIVYVLTKTKIDENKISNERAVISEIAPDGIAGEETELREGIVRSIIPIYDKPHTNDASGYIVKLTAPGGYAGPIEIVALYKASGEFIDARVTESRETPGLGKKAEKSDYMRKFTGLGGSPALAIPLTKQMLDQVIQATREKNGESGTPASDDMVAAFFAWMFGGGKTQSVDSVTGATITFGAIANAIYEGSEQVKKRSPIKPQADNTTGTPAPEARLPAQVLPAPTDYIEPVHTEPLSEGSLEQTDAGQNPAAPDQPQSGGTQ
jgi:RnfABCDGE-type electron transport complex G subunit